MAENNIGRYNVLAMIFTLVIYLISVIPVKAEGTDRQSFGVYFEASSEYNDNIFGLSGSQMSTYDGNDPADETNGRFDDMNSLTDFILTPEIGIRYETESPFGGDIRLSSGAGFNYYLENDKKSYPEFDIRAGHSVGKAGELTVRGDITYGYFKKNYLSGAEDVTESNISSAERIYSSAFYDEYEVQLEYGHDLIGKKNKGFLSEFTFKPLIGGSFRRYNDIFDNRDRNVFLAGLSLDVGLNSFVELETCYNYENINSPGKEELVLFDETAGFLDVNGDYELRASAPLFTVIDRSSEKHIFEIGSTVRITKKIGIYLGYECSETVYSTDNELDVKRYDKSESSWRFRTEIHCKILKDLSGSIGYEYESENDADDGTIIYRSAVCKLKYTL